MTDDRDADDVTGDDPRAADQHAEAPEAAEEPVADDAAEGGTDDAAAEEPTPHEDPIEPGPDAESETDVEPEVEAESPVQERPARRARKRRDAPDGRRPLRWGRGAAGAVLSVVAIGAVVGGANASWPTVGGEAASVDVSPDASSTVAACSGPLLAVGRDAADASAITVAADISTTSGTTGDAEPAVDTLTADGVKGDADPARYVLDPEGRESESLSVATSADIRDDDLSGFAASACRTASMESWIVGGSTTVGATDVLLIANPGAVNATVELGIFGAEGEKASSSGDAIAIPAGTQVALPLAGIVGSESAPVVRVTATGAPVRAALQSAEVRTLDPVGVDVQESVEATERQVFPGVAVTEEAADADVTPAVVRLLSRGDGTATITVRAEGESRDAIAPIELPVEADVPVSADLSGLEPGRYTVSVEGDGGQIASAVWQTTGPKGDEDFAWQTPSPTITEPVLVAVPDGPFAQLFLVNDGDEQATATVTADGFSEEVSLAAGDGAHVRVPTDDVYELAVDGDGADVRATVAFRDGGSIAAYPVWPDPAEADDVTVYP